MNNAYLLAVTASAILAILAILTGTILTGTILTVLTVTTSGVHSLYLMLRFYTTKNLR